MDGDMQTRVMRTDAADAAMEGPRRQAVYVHPLTRAQLMVLHEDGGDVDEVITEDIALARCGREAEQVGHEEMPDAERWRGELVAGDCMLAAVALARLRAGSNAGVSSMCALIACFGHGQTRSPV